MNKENKGKGMSSCEQLTEMLFGNGVNKSMQMCFDLLMNLTPENEMQTLVVIHGLCLDINHGNDPKIRDLEMRAKAISCIVQATYLACQDLPKLRMQWFQMLYRPLSSKQPEGPCDSFKMEPYIYGVIIGMLKCLNDHTYQVFDNSSELDRDLETTFADILCELISKPGTPLHIILPVDVIRDEINKGLVKYIKPKNQEIVSQRKVFIGLMLRQIKQNLVAGSPNNIPDPWSGRLLNYHFSKQLLEKLIYAIWGSFSLMEMLRYITEGGLRYDVKTSPTEDDLTKLTLEFDNALQPETEFPVADGDYQTHFDLGIAFKEMGEIEQAIGEFEVAAKLAKTSEDRLECQRMKAICLEELGKNKK